MAALSDPRSYFAAEVKRVQQKQTAANGKSDIKDVHANGAANGTKKSSKTNKNHENRGKLLNYFEKRKKKNLKKIEI